MVHKQQVGHKTEDILYGLCQALVRNYLNNVGLGKEIKPLVVFQGGVAFNQAIVKSFEKELEHQITVPPHHEIMGAVGAALLVHEELVSNNERSQFKGFEVSDASYHTSSFECKACPNLCEIAQLGLDEQILARWGGRCDMWERSPSSQESELRK